MAAKMVAPGVWWLLNTLPTTPELASYFPVYCVQLFSAQWLVEMYVACSQRK